MEGSVNIDSLWTLIQIAAFIAGLGATYGVLKQKIVTLEKDFEKSKEDYKALNKRVEDLQTEGVKVRENNAKILHEVDKKQGLQEQTLQTIVNALADLNTKMERYFEGN